MSRRRIFLHAGIHKTGSTSIQNFLSDNRQELSRRGYAVMDDIASSPISSDPIDQPANCALLAHLFLRDGFGSQLKLRSGVRRYGILNRLRGIHGLRNTLAALTTPNVIISAESFSFLRTARERAMMRVAFAGYRVVPVIFLRERKSWLESWEKQVGWLRARLEEEGRISDGCADGYREHTLAFDEDSDNGDHASIRRFFGSDAVYLSYEDAVAREGSVLPAFLKAIGLDPDSFAGLDGYWANRSQDKPRLARARGENDQ